MEVRTLEQFYKLLNDDPDRAFYGYSHVHKAAEHNAIEKLLVTDSLFRYTYVRFCLLSVSYNRFCVLLNLLLSGCFWIAQQKVSHFLVTNAFLSCLPPFYVDHKTSLRVRNMWL